MGLIITSDTPHTVNLTGGTDPRINADQFVDSLVTSGWTELTGMGAVLDLVAASNATHNTTSNFWGVTFHFRDPLQPFVGLPEVQIGITKELTLDALLGQIAAWTPFTGVRTGSNARLTANNNKFIHCDYAYTESGGTGITSTNAGGLAGVTTGAMRNVVSIANDQGRRFSVRFMRRAGAELYLTLIITNAAQTVWPVDAQPTKQFLFADRMVQWNASQTGMSAWITGSQFMVYKPGQVYTDRSDLWCCLPYIRSSYSITDVAFGWMSAGVTGGGYTPTGPRSSAVIGENGDTNNLTFSREVSKFGVLEGAGAWVNNASTGVMTANIGGYEWPEIPWDRETRLIGYGGLGDFFEPRIGWSYGGPNNGMKLIGQIPDCFVVAGVYPAIDSTLSYLGKTWKCMSTMEVLDTRIGAMYLRTS